MTPTLVQRIEYEVGNRSGYGYTGVRVYHHVVIRELSSSTAQARIPTIQGKQSVRNSPGWHLSPCQRENRLWGGAAYPLSADGTHSRVRMVLYQDIEPQFSNTLA
ncbi:FAD/NAD(P)-binding domain-containing protein [Penicillium verrucosum]|uniref:FAD/NAD(P)-binding domain-containing protein n=1 Tax=Penicillium verrucosum TaxID=60171 RepID=UPI002544F204|nr:FAD/NAD(P)-binding domain-containing protein [Penicillium verrucosum]KAJ5942442.1 FAD/NAD(P)-binding domain-containing protein [Penicillium verrucosum]